MKIKFLVSILYISFSGLSGAFASTPDITGTTPREWKAPVYGNQSKAIGYSSSAFATPKGMDGRVKFWVDVYTKYSSDQGIIHDAENVEKVYQIVDLKGLKTEDEKQKKVDEVKDVIAKKNKLSEEAKGRLRYQMGQKDRMQDAIYYSGRYIEEMEKIFRAENLPVELVRLAFVESSFNIMARSRVGASGLWQTMPYTAKPYRMISSAVDKRNHPIEATKVAAKLLRQNYRMLQSWPLAVTGYNHGPTGVRKMTETYKTRELNELINNVRSRRSFGFASKNFYASFLAAVEVEKNAAKYFPNVAWAQPLDAKDLRLPVNVRYKDILAWFDGDDRMAQLFNPHLTSNVRRGKASVPARTVIAVPKEKYDIALISLAGKNRTIAMEEKKSSNSQAQ